MEVMEWKILDVSELIGDFKFAYISSNSFYSTPLDPEHISGNFSGDVAGDVKSLSTDLACDQDFTASSFFICPANRWSHNSFYNSITINN